MNAIFPKWKAALLAGEPGAALNGIVRATFVSADYKFSADHEFLADVTTERIGSALLRGKTFAGGRFDAVDSEFPLVSGGAEMVAIILYVDSGAPGTSRLVLYLDEKIQGIPFTPSGGDVFVQWNDAGIFSL